jgi:acyl-CoA reductase-like NAD-dependent aldehyde dehydrogenase
MDAHTPTLWHDRAQTLTYRTQAFINGRFQPSASSATFDNHSPIDGRLLCTVSACDAADVDAAVQAARTAFDSGVWSRMPLPQRKAALKRFAQALADHADELALLECLDMGKPITMAQGDVAAVISSLEWFAEWTDKIYDEQAPVGPKAVGLINHEPVGVVAAVVPWNYPLLMAAYKFAPALAAGNCVIVKPAEQSPLSMLRVAELAAEATLPAGVLQVIPGFGETAGQALGRHMGVDMLTFTGSTTVGKLFLRYSADSNMKQVSLECGGKSPNIVFADARNLKQAAEGAAAMIYANSGQVCVAGSRLLVQASVAEAFMAAFTQAAQIWQPGDPLNPATRMGAIVDATQCARVLGYIEDGKAAGATLAFGGRQVRMETGGTYIEPTLFTGVRNDMRIAREEIFGPVLSLMTFETAEEALRLANDSSYGLQAYVWTSNLDTAHTMARGLQAGTVLVNHAGSSGITMPFGGYKQSGLGRDKGVQSILKYCEVKSTYINLA